MKTRSYLLVLVIGMLLMSTSGIIGNGSVMKSGGDYIKPICDISQTVGDSTPGLNINVGSIGSAENMAVSGSDTGIGVGSNEIYPSNTLLGVCAAQEVNPKFNFTAPPSGIGYVLYAPTMAAPNHNPLEISTGYIRWTSDMLTEKFWAVWDHTNPGFHTYKKMDATFVVNYVRRFKEGRMYFTKIVKVGSEWQAQLWNFNHRKWEKEYGSSNISSFNNGWDSYEVKFGGDCPSIPEVESVGLRVYDPQGANGPGWYLVDSKYGHAGYGDNFKKCGYIGKTISPFSHWQVYETVTTDKRAYKNNQDHFSTTNYVKFTIKNWDTKSIWIDQKNPLKIVNINTGQMVYDPTTCSSDVCTPVVPQQKEIKPGGSYIWTWDQSLYPSFNGVCIPESDCNKVGSGTYQGLLIGDEGNTKSNYFDVV